MRRVWKRDRFWTSPRPNAEYPNLIRIGDSTLISFDVMLFLSSLAGSWALARQIERCAPSQARRNWTRGIPLQSQRCAEEHDLPL